MITYRRKKTVMQFTQNPRSLNLHLQAFPCNYVSPMASSFIKSNKPIFSYSITTVLLCKTFSSSPFRSSNSKTATTAFRFTSILALIFCTNNQQRQQQQNVVRFCQTSLATLISCHRNMRKHSFAFVCATMSNDNVS